MTRIAICSPNIETGDAVGNDVIGMSKAITENGYSTSLYGGAPETSEYKVHSLKKIRKFLKEPNDIFLYHYAIGWQPVMEIIQSFNCKKIIKYHNVTPPEYYEGISSAYASACRIGREQLKRIIDIGNDLYLADSEYNKRDLIELGAEETKCYVVPPFHHIDRLVDIEADLEQLDKYNTDHTVNILFVGRLVPNKGHNALIDAFIIYNNHYNPNSRLLIVGGEDKRLLSYVNALKEKIGTNGLNEKILFTGKVTDQILKAIYLATNVFMSTSLHEGFCVPLVEAMSMKIPIVAHGTSAIPYTIGNTGIIWDEFDPHLFAASVDRIVRDEKVRIHLAETGWSRYQEIFTNDKIKKTFIESISHLL